MLRIPTIMAREESMRTSKTLSLSLPLELAREAECIAKKEGRTKSELFREALRRYIQEQRWMDLRRYGAQQARKLGIREPEVERVIEEYRKGR
jgi:CopG family transcriptional regulator/antitoxin EndoAI